MFERGHLDEVLAGAVASGQVPGVVGVVASAEALLYQGAFGFRDQVAGEVMTLDTVFRVASMTKVVTSVAALQLVEQGRLELDAPVADFVPSFADLQVLDGFDGDRPLLRPPRSQTTVRQLFCHTSGLAYDTWNDKLSRYQQLTGAPGVSSGLLASLSLPLVCDPGTAFNYGTSSDWLGRVVEEVSGQRLDVYFDEHVLGPLAMGDTTPAPSAEQRARCAPVHVRGEDRAWVPTGADNAPEPEFYSGGHSLYTTPGDYLRLQQTLLRGGEIGGRKIVGPETVGEMFENQTGEIDVPPFVSVLPRVSESLDLGPGRKWGLGLLLNTEVEEGSRPPGSGGWAGVFNTFFWVDRTNGLAAGLYTQTLPFYDQGVIACYQDFEHAIYA
jgi:methyl acetate hydrolase